MAEHRITWAEIDRIGAELGASYANRLKWRRRGVPPAWQIEIAKHLSANGARVDFDSFAEAVAALKWRERSAEVLEARDTDSAA